ncbi:MAG: hypothetical protein M9885_12295 [Burkholderiaceae bacterium]|nr:hypothetical protein [Burkholderiaceae bacterium]
MPADERRPVDRNALYEEVWTQPVTIVAERYGLSDVGLAKLCRRVEIPVPSRGYWAKVKAGRIMRKVPLKPMSQRTPLPLGPIPLSPEQRKTRAVIRDAVAKAKVERPSFEVPPALLAPHQLVRAAELRLKRRDGWDSETGLRSAPNEVLHLEVTRENLDRALRLADTLIRALEVSDVAVHVDSQNRATVLESAGTLVPLAITEKLAWTEHVPTRAERRAQKRYDNSYRSGETVDYPHIPQFDPQPTGRLTITVGRKYAARSWNDTERKRLEERVGHVVAGIIAFIEIKRAEEAERARRAEAHRIALEKYEREVARYESERQRLRSLRRDAAQYRRARELREYLDAYERAACDAGRLVPKVEDWLAWARAKADCIDPLILMSDVILDAPKPERPSFW